MRRLPILLVLLAACGGTPRPATPAAPAPAPEPAAATPATPATPVAAVDDGPPATGKVGEGLLPRSLLFGNPERTAGVLSPDGKWLGYLAPQAGVLNVWIAPIAAGKVDLAKARVITGETARPVREWMFAFDGKHLLYLQDQGGDEDFHLHAVELATGKSVDLTPLPKVTARIEAIDPSQPGVVVVGLNDRNPQLHDLYRVDLTTGERTKVLENPGFARFSLDHSFTPRLAFEPTPDGGQKVKKAGAGGAWEDFTTIASEDALTTSFGGFDKTNKLVYGVDSRGRDTGALVQLELATGKTRVLAEDARADAGDFLVHPSDFSVQAVSFDYDRVAWKVLDRRIARDLANLAKVQRGDVQVVSRSLDDKLWSVAFTSDDQPVKFYLWDRATQKATFLWSNRPALEQAKLVRMTPVVIPARDGLQLVSYLSLPAAADPDGDGKPGAPVPLVLLVHGGPWGRDSWGPNTLHQFLANRGYGVLSVNFRGSTGFGKKYVNAGNGQWGKAMHDDLLDAVGWAVSQKITGKDTVCIMGGSYGGYATLAGLTLTPEAFACGVDIVGPSNIITLLSSIPPYWAPAIAMFKARVGDFTTEAGKQALTAVSPLTYADKIVRPLLIGQGANDPRVKQAESDRIVAAMKAKHIPVTYVLFPDEGHGFARPENNLAFFAVVEAFLSAHLGGVYQPMTAEDFAGSTMQIRAGRNGVPGLPSEAGRVGAAGK
jgi:dipeptidyl aminopeptidase/acylaminoacyl peptidase